MPLPQEGGCWFCYGDGGPMEFSTEFDCWFHGGCLVQRLEVDPMDPEARIIGREYGLQVDPPAPPPPGQTVS